jgi:hypothetical protein
MADEGVILPAREYEDAAQIHGRPRILAPFERETRKQSVLERAKRHIQETPER